MEVSGNNLEEEIEANDFPTLFCAKKFFPEKISYLTKINKI